MNYEAEVFYENGIVHVRMSGVDSYTANLDAFSRMVACCKEFNCYAVLGIQNMTPLSTVDAFEVTHIFEQLGISTAFNSAWVEPNEAAREQIKVSMRFLREKGLLHGHVFVTQAEAMAWLEKNAQHPPLAGGK